MIPAALWLWGRLSL